MGRPDLPPTPDPVGLAELIADEMVDEFADDHPELLDRMALAGRRALLRYADTLVPAVLPLPVRQSAVYYLRRADQAIKIGYSIDLPNRINSIAKTHGPLELLAVESGGWELEQQRHRQFAADQINPQGEWFWPSALLLAHVIALSESDATKD